MAVYTLRSGAFTGSLKAVESVGGELVDYSARNCTNNLMSVAPPNLDRDTYGFTAAFMMTPPSVGDGKWEGHYPKGSSYRLDLQGFTAANSEGVRYANWQLQTNTKESKTVAAVLLRCGKAFSQGQMYHALKMSAKNSQICVVD